ncbi:dihydrodipicolinate synthase family protein [Aquitalea sp. LB_tupeE]|uniref:dihydrodipicolinate synthase family protein n=1 Tax=Aquitalea sp. LB_tupeE TaxID=2748078 RepID=UPI0015C07E07|nr:dihydrodipicolinate synthase family protein [Aquitalea sp. LB_tupeE]NWK78820.1 dihydrodipicolinate synthase family protein [Aquitalea sp. LB_tupeE]
MFYGLSAFPLSPLRDGKVDEKSFLKILNRLVTTKVDSIGVLGSTGSYMYLSKDERRKILELSMDAAGDIPVIAGIGGLTTRDVLNFAEDAQKHGASAVLLAPVSYQSLTENEVYEMYKSVTSSLSVPLCIYDNPGTTHFEFSDLLYSKISSLPQVGAIKIPGISLDIEAAKLRMATIRKFVTADVKIGISGDSCAAIGLTAGCDLWFSVIGGLFPEIALGIAKAIRSGNVAEGLSISSSLSKLWAMFDKYGGSLRVISAAAELIGVAGENSLPLPILPISKSDRVYLMDILNELNVVK